MGLRKVFTPTFSNVHALLNATWLLSNLHLSNQIHQHHNSNKTNHRDQQTDRYTFLPVFGEFPTSCIQKALGFKILGIYPHETGIAVARWINKTQNRNLKQLRSF